MIKKWERMRRRILYVVISLGLLAVFLVSLTPSESDATPPEDKHHKWLREIGLLTGYASAPLTKKTGDYEVIPLLPQFGFDIHRLVHKLNLKPNGVFSFMVEPLMNVVINPDTNEGVG